MIDFLQGAVTRRPEKLFIASLPSFLFFTGIFQQACHVHPIETTAQLFG